MQIRNEKLLRYADQTCLSDMFIYTFCFTNLIGRVQEKMR